MVGHPFVSFFLVNSIILKVAWNGTNCKYYFYILQRQIFFKLPEVVEVNTNQQL